MLPIFSDYKLFWSDIYTKFLNGWFIFDDNIIVPNIHHDHVHGVFLKYKLRFYLYVIILVYNIVHLCNVYSVTYPNLLFNEHACSDNTEQCTCLEWSTPNYYSCRYWMHRNSAEYIIINFDFCYDTIFII